jgi:hypothetical protein
MSSVAASPLADLLEKDWQAQVVDLARRLGWRRIYHTHDSRRSAHGFPDLVLCRDRVVFLELKCETGKLTEEQRGWLDALRGAGVEAYVARPRNLQALAEILASRGRPVLPVASELVAS